MSFPAYPAYKESGVKWLPEVPEHWEVRRNKQAFRIVSTLVGSKSKDFQLLSLTLRGVIPRDMESGKGKFPAEFDTYQTVEPGDIVFCLFDIDETPRTVGISRDYGMITGAYTVARAFPAADPRFIYYCYFAIDLRKGLRPFYTGLRKVVRPETFMNIELSLPPRSEQANICNFLDHETARIDALIEEQQRLIELLKEKRQAVISHAVTKGLDPTVQMKDSGVKWLGEVPAQWAVSPLKFLIEEKVAGPYGASLTKAMYTDSGYRVYGQQQVISDDFSIGDYYISEEKFREMQRYVVFPGDVLVSVMGTIGRVSVVPAGVEVGIINPRLVRYKFAPSKVASEFVKILLMSFRYQSRLREESQGSTMEGLNMVILGDLPLVLPPLDAQHPIVAFVKNYDSNFNELVSQAASAVDLLQERR
jgi:type I restriction enzyme S subunit